MHGAEKRLPHRNSGFQVHSVYTATALGNLTTIARYLALRSTNGAKNIRGDIQTSIQSAAQFPLSGRKQFADMRKLVTRRYKYVIYYKIDPDRDQIQITSIFHPAQERDTP